MKKAFYLAALLLIISLAVSGCKSDAGPSAAQSSEAQSSEARSGESTDEVQSGEAGSGESTGSTGSAEEVTIMVAAAASLEYSYTQQLIPMFEEKYPHIKVEGTYDSSGKLQVQIESGLEADVFMSASTKQMQALKEKSLVDEDTVVDLLENRIVLIASAASDTAVTSFEEIEEADMIAIGDPESVPAGQYAGEVLTSLGIYDKLQPKFSLGTNVTEVLNWVAEGSAEVGIVYATDAATTDKVKVLSEAPQDSLKQKVIYPVALVSSSKNKDAAATFVDFLSSPEAIEVFESYGFTENK